jgi:hypothetical protein
MQCVSVFIIMSLCYKINTLFLKIIVITVMYILYSAMCNCSLNRNSYLIWIEEIQIYETSRKYLVQYQEETFATNNPKYIILPPVR